MNDVIKLLHERVSIGKLTEPAPSPSELEAIYQSALTAPDHKRLKPWKYLTVQGDARLRLGECMVEAARASGQTLSEEVAEKLKHKPLRAPLIIIAVVDPVEHEKVPEIEQTASLAAGVENMLIATQSLGYGAYWRTGGMAFNRAFHQLLGLSETQQILGFIYMGTPDCRTVTKPRPTVNEYFSEWTGRD